MEPRRYDDTEDDAGQGRVELSEPQARTLARIGEQMRVLGLVQAVVAGAAVLLVLAAVAYALYNEHGPGLSGLGVLGTVFLALMLFQIAAPAVQGMMVFAASQDLAAVADPKQRHQPRLIQAFARMRQVFLLEILVALMLLVKELKFAV